MALLRRNKDLGGTRYQMREKVFAIGDDFWIETDEGRRAYKVNGKALRIRSTFVIENPSGDELMKIQEKKLSIRDAMRIERGGATVATVKKALVSPLRHRFNVERRQLVGEAAEAVAGRREVDRVCVVLLLVPAGERVGLGCGRLYPGALWCHVHARHVARRSLRRGVCRR